MLKLWIWVIADHLASLILFYIFFWISAVKVDRAVSTSIYFLLPSGSVSRLHRIPMAETWHFYLGEPLTVSSKLLSLQW